MSAPVSGPRPDGGARPRLMPAPAQGAHSAACGTTPDALQERCEVDVQGKVPALMAHLAELLSEAAGVVREIGEIHLAATPNSGLMSSVEKGSSAPRAKLLTPHDLAAVFQVDAKTIRRWRREGRLPAAIEIAGVVRWRPEEIDAWIDARGGQ